MCPRPRFAQPNQQRRLEKAPSIVMLRQALSGSVGEARSTRIDMRPTRRDLLRQAFASGSLWGFGFFNARTPAALDQTSQDPRSGTFLGALPFSEEGHPPMGRAIGSELDGRRFTDLSALTEEHPITPPDEFFIRTRVSRLLDTSAPWTIQISGAVNEPAAIPMESLMRKARPMGIHLMECSGNTRAARFGMLSTAEWDGVPLQEILGMFKPRISGARVHIAGFDQYQEDSETSIAGAGWIFSPDQLHSAGAFLATGMNGRPLTPDHGSPVRLVVPGWYGCVSIKWVNQIGFVPEDAPPTSQMEEYAGRTMQAGSPALARDYRPATVGAAAMPIRIEKWRIGGKIRYRVIGIRWGNFPREQGLDIRFNPDESFVPVENHQLSAMDSWSFWRHEWVPARPGRFTVRLRLNQTAIDAERLNSGYYDRSVDISEI